MKVSVLVAAHRHGPQMREALASVRAQTHSDWDLIVVEHDSADETRKIVGDFGAAEHRHVHYLNLGETHGPASVRNRLIELATSEWAAFLDPTDRWTPGHLADVVAEAEGDAGVVASDVRFVDRATGRTVGEVAVPAQLPENSIRALFKRNFLPVPSAVAFRRDLATRAGPFDPRFSSGETRDFWLRCALHGARFAATRRQTCESPARGKANPALALAEAEHTVQFYDKHREVSAVPAAMRRRFFSASLLALGRLLRTSDPVRATRCFWRAWSLQPVDIQALGQFALIGLGSGVKPPPAANDQPRHDCA